MIVALAIVRQTARSRIYDCDGYRLATEAGGNTLLKVGRFRFGPITVGVIAFKLALFPGCSGVIANDWLLMGRITDVGHYCQYEWTSPLEVGTPLINGNRDLVGFGIIDMRGMSGVDT